MSRTPTNTWRNRHMVSTKSTHDLGLSAPNKNDTRSLWKSTHDLDLNNRRNWFLQNESPAHIQLIFTDLIQIEFVVPLGNALQTPISIVKFQLQLSYLNGMHMHAFPSLHRREIPCEPTNECVSYSAT